VSLNKRQECVFLTRMTLVIMKLCSIVTIEVRPQIKLLGLIFDKKLYWYPQAMTAIVKANKSQLK
jgi:hypothetical protein